MTDLANEIVQLVDRKPGLLSGREVYKTLVLLQCNPDLCAWEVSSAIWKLIEKGQIKMRLNLKLEPGSVSRPLRQQYEALKIAEDISRSKLHDLEAAIKSIENRELGLGSPVDKNQQGRPK